MVIYADILVLVNLYVDFFLLWCVKKFLHLKSGGGRLVLGALAGALSSLLCLLPAPSWAFFLLGILSALLCACAAFSPVSPLLFLKAALSFWAFSFLLAGFLLFFSGILGPGSLCVMGNAVYFPLSPLFLFCATSGAYILFLLYHRLFPKRPPLRCCRVTLRHKGATVRLFCKADTGCNLREPFSGLPVLVAERRAMGDIHVEGIRLIPFSSVGGEGLLPAFRPEALEAGGKKLDCYVAVTDKKLGAGEFDGLLNPELFPNPPFFE